MAIININANLNGGDAQTPNDELFYRIYGDLDAYASPIHTTGTAIADADVTVTGDVVDILNVDGTTNTSFKIAAVDGAGNEGILSDAKDGSVIIEDDDFTGTSGSILVPTNPNTTSLTLSQNDGLFTESLTIGDGTIPDAGDDWNDYFKHATGFAVGGTYVMSFDMEMSQNDGSNHLFGFTTVLGGDVVQIHDTALWTGIDATNLRAYQRTSNVFTQDTNVVLDASVRRTYKVAIEGANCSFYYWNGSSWTQVGTTTPHGLTGTLYPFFLCRTSINTIVGQTAQIHNYFLSNAEFSSQYPS